MVGGVTKCHLAAAMSERASAVDWKRKLSLRDL